MERVTSGYFSIHQLILFIIFPPLSELILIIINYEDTDADLYLEGHFIDGCSLWLIIDLHPIDFHHQTSETVYAAQGVVW